MKQGHHIIRDWISEGENNTLEFKTQVTQVNKIARTLCAFANTKGGRLLIGVMDDGEIVGVVELKKEQEKLEEAAKFYCDPPVSITFEGFEDDYLIVLVARIAESNEKPHRVQQKNGEWQTFVRAGSSIRKASKLVEKTLLNAFEPPKVRRKLNSKEQGLVAFLEKRESITVLRFSQLVNISRRRARRMLIDLVQEGILHLHDDQKEDYYTLV